MARKKKHEEHVNAEAWAIPYGDLVTLLFALFTVMYAMSSVNEGKFRVLSDSMIAAFRGAPKSIRPINEGNKESGKGGDKKLTGVAPTVLLRLTSTALAPPKSQIQAALLTTTQAALGQDGTQNQPGNGTGNGTGGAPGGSALERMQREVQDAMQGLIDAKMVTVKRENLWLEVEINTDILFSSGSGAFAADALPVLDKLADVLKPFPNPIRVEGHTDDRPIRTAAFPSNWELSAARAASVVHEFTKAGVDPLRLEIVGFGEYHPLQPNDSVTGRNANRRVAILILEKTAADEATKVRAGALSSGAAVAADAAVADASGAENRIAIKVPATELEKTVLIDSERKTEIKTEEK